jgi:hypothetical protein
MHAIRIRGRDLPGNPQGETGLASGGRARQRNQPRRREQALDGRKLPLPPN